MATSDQSHPKHRDEQLCRDKTCSGDEGKSTFLVFIDGHRGILYTAIPTTCVLLILLCWRIFKFLRNRKTESTRLPTHNYRSYLDQEVDNNVKVFTFDEIKKATKNFGTRIGQGAQGAVFKGRLEGNIEVAIKKSWGMNPSTAKSFSKEISVLTKIRHEHIVVLHGYCLQEDVVFLVYEFLPKGDLYRFIKDKSNETPWSVRLAIIIKVARGLVYLHSKEVMHRDIKPLNILLDKDLEPKISDFGISKFLYPDDESYRKASFMKGTHGYMCPHYANDGEYELSCDTFSFGVLVAEIMSGLSALFEEDGKTVVLSEYFKKQSARDLNKCLDEQVKPADKHILSRAAALACECMHITKGERPSMNEVLERLENLQETFTSFDDQLPTGSDTAPMLPQYM